MIYLSGLLGHDVFDAQGEKLGQLTDLIITTGEAFPRVTGLVYREGGAAAVMVSWRKYVADLDKDAIRLTIPRAKVRFSYLQNDEILLVRDLLEKNVVDTQHKRVVKATDVKFSGARNQLRLLGIETGPRGALRSVSPRLEAVAVRLSAAFGQPLEESILSWSHIDLLDHSAGPRAFSAAHKRLSELHPADLADVLEQLDEVQRVRVIEQLDHEDAAEAISELEDEVQLQVIADLAPEAAVALLDEMDPDDAADILRGLGEDKAASLLAAMDPEGAREVSSLLGYAERTAGSVMTSDVTFIPEAGTVADAVALIREVSDERETVHYVYVTDDEGRLTGVLSLRDLLTAEDETPLSDLASHDLIVASPDDDRREVADAISKYGLLAIPVVDEHGILLGIVTVDDAMEVLEEEKAEEFEMATGAASSTSSRGGGAGTLARLGWFVRRNSWLAFWAAACLVLAMTVDRETASLVLPSVLMLPVVLILCDDVITAIKSDILSQSEPFERLPVWRLVVRESMVGVGLSVLLMVLFTALFSLFFLATGREETVSAVFRLTLPTAVTVPLALVIGVGVGEAMRARYERTDEVSGTVYSAVMMAVGTAVQVLLALALASEFAFRLV